ncbi:Hsp20/alpha crystallin family protein [Trichocoleus sp. FACHB-591]|uniref:Hsp20/alpha crystallin family protein n=1 Tax=Trichocoleus sp. FACHB-591 TaxID=2692872 RepID=UPI0016870D16|nr:Hsp20/alpha crystallin family protein [Trichocoleus sp. FACHB-591]MBD2094798.1 Hsp20/alpha crystallin family protein [Trichocoleus sp. FACHB-591]
MRTLIRWQPRREFDIVRRQLDQLFDEISNINFDSALVKPRELGPRERGAAWMPAIEINDIGAALVLRAEVPGVDAEHLDVQVSRDAVAIQGEYRSEQKTDEQGHFRSEFRYGNFRRVIPLGVPVQNDQVQAELKDGILTLTLPKVAPEKAVVKLNLSTTESATSLTAAPETTETVPTSASTQAPVAESILELTSDVWSENPTA